MHNVVDDSLMEQLEVGERMPTITDTAPASKTKVRVGRVMSGLVVLFLVFDSVMKFIQPAPVVEASQHLGLPLSLTVPIGITLLVCTTLYAIPRTSILGAILLTGYLGGAIASHLRVDSPLFTHVLFGVYLGLMVWGGLYLRDGRLRALLPLRR
jgi:hypothetical protein